MRDLEVRVMRFAILVYCHPWLYTPIRDLYVASAYITFYCGYTLELNKVGPSCIALWIYSG